MISYEMAWNEASGRWRIWRVTHELVAEGLTLVQGERLLGQLRAAPGKGELQGCSLGAQGDDKNKCPGDAANVPGPADTDGGCRRE